jgi:hypothetical protein
MVRVFVWIGTLLAATGAEAPKFELIGHVQPEQPLPVYLHGATAPFRASTEADLNGSFIFGSCLPARTC